MSATGGSEFIVEFFNYVLILIVTVSAIIACYTVIHFVFLKKELNVTQLRREDDSKIIKLSYKLILKLMTTLDLITLIAMILFFITLGLLTFLMTIRT